MMNLGYICSPKRCGVKDINDVVNALIACLDADEQIMNIGSGVGTALGVLANIFKPTIKLRDGVRELIEK